MADYYNNHVVTGSLEILAANLTAVAPARIELQGMAGGLHRVHLYTDYAAGDIANVRLTDGQQQIVPLSGWLAVPADSILTLETDRVLPGPPWTVFVEAWGAAGTVYAALEMADIRETDNELQILRVLQAIYTEFFKGSKR